MIQTTLHQKKLVIGIAGEICSGKDTLAHFVASTLKNNGRNVSVMRTSDVLREIFMIIGLSPKRTDFHNMTEILRHYYGEDILARAMKKRLDTEGTEVILWVGLRSQYDMEVLASFSNSKLVFVDAKAEERFQRINDRGENIDDSTKTWEQFLEDCNRSTEQTIQSFRNHAELIINNSNNCLLEAQQILLDDVSKSLSVITETAKLTETEAFAIIS